MKNNNCIKALHSYQSANLTDDEIVKHFVVRQNEFQRIISEIKRDDMTGSIQHYLLIGRRGSGKSTLLSRIKAEVNRDKKLNEKLVVVYLSEEQAGVYRLHDLWDLILRDLDSRKIKVDNPVWSAVEEDAPTYSKSLYFSIQKALKQENRKLLLLLDNIDRIFDNIGEDAHLLRELLTNYKDLRIIGGSTRMSEHYWRYDKPFYQFFRIIRMESLTKEEVHQLLQYWSDCLNQPEIKHFIEKNPGKIETIRVLTDGMPRTLQNFIEILIDRSNQNGFEYLRMIIDRATPVFQERLNYLPPAQRKIVLELSNFWDAVKVNQIILACKMPGKTISAQLNNLVKNEIVEKIKGLKKDNLYRLSERFFNLWLLMTQGGPKEKRQIKYLTVFLENWYNQTELLAIFIEHLKGLYTGKLKPDYAAIMTTALAHSKYISLTDRDLVIEKYRSINDSFNSYMEYLPQTFSEIIDGVKEKTITGDFQGARQLIDSIEQEDPFKDGLYALVYHQEEDYNNAEKFYLSAINKGHIGSILGLAILYSKTGRNEEAENFFLQSIEKGDVDALNNIAILYKDTNRPEDAEKYFLQAIEKGHVDAMYNLAVFYYFSNKNKIKAIELIEQYLLKEKDFKGHAFYSVLLLWLGKMTEFERIVQELVAELISKNEISLLDNLFQEFLVHRQYNLAWQWFNHPEYGEKLKEMIKPLYFVTAGFIQGQEEETLKPGPELEESITGVRNSILKWQKFYNG